MRILFTMKKIIAWIKNIDVYDILDFVMILLIGSVVIFIGIMNIYLFKRLW
jgi:hypothetical protein